jgi:hypothetical protein
MKRMVRVAIGPLFVVNFFIIGDFWSVQAISA